MKKLTLILFIILLLVAGVAFAKYVQMSRKENAVSTIGSVTTPKMSQTTGTGFSGTTSVGVVPSPLPTVAQIPLTITSPISGSFVTTAAVTVKGKTTPKAEVFINDSQVVADAQGNFSVSITLDEGENTIVVTANDATGNYSEQDITITYDLAQ